MSTASILVAVDGTHCRRSDGSAIADIAQRATDAGNHVFYVPGVGTSKGFRLRGAIAGREFGPRIRNTYVALTLLCNEIGGEVALYFIGYSRGGALALSLANLIRDCGIPQNPASELFGKEAMVVYGRREGYAGVRQAEFMEKWSCTLPPIRFMGLFDPVGSLSLPLPNRPARLLTGHHRFDLPSNVERYFSLLSIHENRRLFKPVLQTGLYAVPVTQCWTTGTHADIGGTTSPRLGAVARNEMARQITRAGMTIQMVGEEDPCAPIFTDARHMGVRPETRPVGVGRGTGECVHPSVQARLEAGLSDDLLRAALSLPVLETSEGPARD